MGQLHTQRREDLPDEHDSGPDARGMMKILSIMIILIFCVSSSSHAACTTPSGMAAPGPSAEAGFLVVMGVFTAPPTWVLEKAGVLHDDMADFAVVTHPLVVLFYTPFVLAGLVPSGVGAVVGAVLPCPSHEVPK